MRVGGESTRQLKVARQLQRDLSEIFRLHASRLCAGRMVTVTRVRMSPDLEYAQVYVSLFPSSDADGVLGHLRAHQKEIRHHLGRLVGKQLRVVPDLTLELDDSLDYIERIDQLLGGSGSEGVD